MQEAGVRLPVGPRGIMNEIKLKIGRRIYRLSNNNGKYGRAISDAGSNAKPWRILALYDAHGGYIQDERGSKVENGIFWPRERARSERAKKWRAFSTAINEWSRHPLVVTAVIMLCALLFWRIFGFDPRASLPPKQ